MMKQEILNTLDNSNDGYYCHFIDLGHGYSYLIDTRLNVFRNDTNQWAIAVERLGYNPRAGSITLEIYYYGNCLVNLESYNNRSTNSYLVFPIDQNSYNDTIEGESLRHDADFWLVREKKIILNHYTQHYYDAGIELKEYEPNQINIEEACRFSIINHRQSFRATDKELYKSIPSDLKKILVLDEWFHKDFHIMTLPFIADEHLRQIRDEFVSNHNKENWENNRPSSYETWQLIAEVIATNDPQKYKPTLNSNTHWANWPSSGSL